MSHREVQRLQRSLAALTIGASKAERKIEAELAPLRGGDMTQVVHLPVKGKAGAALTSVEMTVGLPHPFLTRIVVDEDDVEPQEPTFAFGYELASDAAVMLTGCVRDWIEDDSGLVGAVKVRISACAPGSRSKLSFNATAHLSFTGLAAPDEGDDDQGSPVPAVPRTVPGAGEPVDGGGGIV